MDAIQITQLTGPHDVELRTIDDPKISDPEHQVLIEVKAAGVAFPDLLQTRGLYQVRPDPPFTPGSEVAGIVLEAPSTSGMKPGQRVMALTYGGGFAEKVVAATHLTFPLPDQLSFAQGASFLFNYCTSHFALLTRGGLTAGESVLVHGAAGGIGTSAIQIAKAYGASRVIGVVSTPEKAEVATAAGADDVVYADGFLDTIGRHSVDLVVDPVGGDRFTDSLRALKPYGRHLVIGFTGGEIPTVKVNRLLLNNISVVGVAWGAQGRDDQEFVAAQWTDLEPHVVSGALTPPVGPRFPLSDAAPALKSLEQRTAFGKVVLTLEG